MPKKPETKTAKKVAVSKPAASVKPTEKPLASPVASAEPKRVVFRLFECVLRLEIAAEQIGGVGILPAILGDNSTSTADVSKLNRELGDLQNAIKSLGKRYRDAWAEMQREGV